MKKFAVTVSALLIAFFASFSIYASVDIVSDNAGLLTATEIADIESEIDRVSAEHGVGVYVLTVNSTEGKYIVDFADDYYDENGLGLGEDNSGILLVIAMEDRDWCFSTAGSCINSCYYISDAFIGKLSDGYYRDAFIAFVDAVDEAIIRYDKYLEGELDDPYDYDDDDYYVDSENSWIDSLIIGAICALVIAGIVLAMLSAKMKTVRYQVGARQYVRDGSFKLNNSRDLFLYSQVTKVRRAQESSSSGGGRVGGGGTHTSSGGVSHGGSHGKF